MDHVALAGQELGKVGAVLTGGAGYKSYWFRNDLFLFKYLAMFEYSGRFY
jgi:hypothetical protein